MKEIRVKTPYMKHKEIRAAQGVKIAAQNLDEAVAGASLLVYNKVGKRFPTVASGSSVMWLFVDSMSALVFAFFSHTYVSIDSLSRTIME